MALIADRTLRWEWGRSKQLSISCHQMKILFHAIIMGIAYWGCSISSLPHIRGKFLGRWEAGLQLTIYRQPVRDGKPDEFTWSFASLDALASAMKGHHGTATPGTVIPIVLSLTQAGSSGKMLAAVPLLFLWLGSAAFCQTWALSVTFFLSQSGF